MLGKEATPGGLVKFHTAYKLTREAVRGLLRAMAHGHWACPVPWHYIEMGRLVADAGKRDWDELTAEYSAQLMEGLAAMGCKRSGRGQACERAPAPDGFSQESPLP